MKPVGLYVTFLLLATATEGPARGGDAPEAVSVAEPSKLPPDAVAARRREREILTGRSPHETRSRQRAR